MLTQETYSQNSRSIFGFLILSFTGFFTIFMIITSIINYNQIRNHNLQIFNYQMKAAAKTIENILNLPYLNINKKLNNQTKNLIISGLNKSFFDIEHSKEDIGIYIYDPTKKKIIFGTKNTKKDSSKETYLHNKLNIGFEYIRTSYNKVSKYWYTYTLQTKRGKQITILINNKTKDEIFHQIIMKSLSSLLIMYIFLMVFTYYILYLALKPIRKVNKSVAKINPRKDLKLNIEKMPLEIEPLVEQINHLLESFQTTLNREKRFSGDAAHELKTPIAGLKTQVEIAMSLEDIPSVRVKLKKILDSANRYAHIIDQLLVLSRIEPTDNITFAKKCPINRIVEVTLADNALTAIEKGVEITFNPYKNEMFCYSNDYLLNILAKNLISNAIKYTPSGGSVEISTLLKNNTIIFKVKDSGIGVPEENLKRIFDRFYRETGTKQEGSGLGLAIVTEIVRLHNGSVYAEKNTDQKGISVTVEIPIIEN